MQIATRNDGVEIALDPLPPVWIHYSFPLISIFLCVTVTPGSFFVAFWIGVGIMLSIFAHELGHAWAAHRLGFKPTLIRLTGLGGDCSYEAHGIVDRQRVLIAGAGPLVTLIIGLVCLGLSFGLAFSADLLAGEAVRLPGEMTLLGTFELIFARLGWINLLLLVINLLPAYPLDGGTLFRLAIKHRYGGEQSYYWTALLGLTFAILAKLVFVVGLSLGMLLWFPPPLVINLEAWKTARSNRRNRRNRDDLPPPPMPLGRPRSKASLRVVK